MTLAVQEMTAEEFVAAENIITRSYDLFLDVAQALAAIRDGRGYRFAGFANFDEYCHTRWNMSRFYAHRLITAAQIAEMLPIGNTLAREAQARELTPLLRADPQMIPEAWREAVEEAPDHHPTAADVARVVARKLPRPVPEPGSRPMREAPLLRYCQDLDTPTIVSLILRVVFPDAETALDVTYGNGNFHDGSSHVQVTAHDLLAERAPHGAADFTDMSYAPRSFDVVLFDPPQLADAAADSVMGSRFGTYKQAELERVIRRGTLEAWRIARLGVLVKVCDHIHDEQLQLETDWVRDALGWLRPYEVVHQVRSGALVSPRWEEQLSAYSNGSTYLVFRRDDNRHVRRGVRR